jgi:hypothetical protein
LSSEEGRYDWTRFWVDGSARSWLDTDDFFPDPEAEVSWLQPGVDATKLADEPSAPCLILLGEPGLGKSQAVKDADRELAESPEDPLHQRIDLGAYSDASSIRAKLIDGDQWGEWVSAGRTFFLFLDSLDEAMLQFPGVGDFLIEELRAVGQALPSLRLRVACRSADWTSDLTLGLKNLWADVGQDREAVRELSLAPLREVDFRSAAFNEGIDADLLLSEIRARDLQGLASLPLTAAMLLRIAKDSSGLPDTRLDLYSRGSATLLREENRRRRLVRTPAVDIERRRRIAECLGAALLLSRHHAIALDPARAGRGEVNPVDFEGLRIPWGTAGGELEPPLREGDLTETLSTGLFVKVAPEAVSFAHRSLAEYCAGACLARAGTDPEPLVDLLFTGDDDRRLVPQLREVAAWAAAQNRTVLTAVLAAEPEVLLRIDHLDLPESHRSEVIGALLNVDSAERLNRWDRRIWRSFARLNHGAIGDQLGPVIVDSKAEWSIRRLAINIIRACEVTAAEGPLLELALNPMEPAWLRDDAILALGEQGSRQAREALVPLAFERIEDDVDDQIKGTALAAIFPDLVTVEQVLQSLTSPRNPNLIGAYSSFLREGLPKAISAEDLPAALAWVRQQPIHRGPTDQLQGLADGIIARAWAQAKTSDKILVLLADVLLPRLKAHVDLIDRSDSEYERIAEDPEPRRRLVEILVPRLAEEGMESVTFVVSTPNLIRREDLRWALGHLRRTRGTDTEKPWADIVRFVAAAPLTEEELNELDDLLADPNIHDRLGFLLDPINLDSELAASLRENFGMTKNPEDERPDMSAELDEEIEGYLGQSEGGEMESWWRLNWTLQFDGSGQGPGNADFEADLTEYAGWKRADEMRRSRIVAAAQRALTGTPPDVGSWFGVNSINRVAASGYRALHLITQLSGGSTDGIPSPAWTRWMPILIDFPRYDSTEERLHQELLDAAAAADPGAFTEWVIRKVTIEEGKEEGQLWFLRRFEGIAPQSLVEALISRLGRQPIRPDSLGDLLVFLLKEDPAATIAAVRPRLAAVRGGGASDEMKQLAARIAGALLGLAPSVAWDELAALFRAEPEVGRDAFSALVSLERSAFATSMPDADLAALATWVFEEFPESSDPPIEAEAHFVGTRESIGHFRRSLLDALCERGNEIAVEATKTLYEKYETPNLRFAARRAREAADSNTPAPTPSDVIRAIAGENRAPLDAGDLQRIVMRALARIQRSLQIGQPPAAPELWNTRGSNTPKDEGELSNWLALRLEAELATGIAVTRESLLRGGGKGRGKSGDLLLTAARPGGGERLRLLFEAKGSWEPKIRERMANQLADGYLTETGITHAIYLVFWFARSDWDSDDYRRPKSTFETAEEARAFFDAQAEELSRPGRSLRAVVLDGSLR